MANTLKLSDARSFKLQPMKKNNWVFKFSMIPGNDDNQPDALAFVAHTCSAPSVQYGDITMKRMNEEFFRFPCSKVMRFVLFWKQRSIH